MKCVQCGQEMEQLEGTHRYDASGLKHVILMNVPMYRCPSCKATEVEIPGMEELHLLLGFLVVLQPTRLKTEEAKYLRKHMGYSQEELASYLGVTRGTVTRWESGKPIRLDQDKHLRRMYLTKKGNELQRLPEVSRILTAVIDRLPFPPKNPKLHIRKEDWLKEAAPA